MIERRKSPQPSNPGPFRLYTLQEVAAIFHVPLSTVRFWRTIGKIKVVKPGRHPLVLESHLFEVLGLAEADHHA